jgi:hypothetical protein
MPIGTALLARLGVPIDWGLFVLSLGALAATPVTAGWVARMAGASRAGQYLAMFGALCLAGNAYYALRGGSDPLLLLGGLLVAGGFAMPRSTVRQRYAGLAVIAAGISLAILMRYTGVFLLLAAGLVLFIEIAIRRSWRELAQPIVALAVPAVLFAVLVLRNVALVGNVTGGIESGEPAPVLSVLAGAIRAAVGSTGHEPGAPLGLLAVILLAIGCIVVVVRGASLLSRIREHPLGRRNFDSLQRVVGLALAYSIVTILGLVVLALGRGGDAIVERYMMPLLPMVIVASVAMFCSDSGDVAFRRSALASAYLLFALSLLAVGQYNYASERIKNLQQNDAIAGVKEAIVNEFQSAPLRGCLQGPPASCRVLSSSAQLVGGLTGAEVLGLAPHGYSARYWTTDEVRPIVSAYRVRYILLHASDSDAPGASGRKFFADLRANRVPSWLRLVSSSRRLQVFEVIDSTLRSSATSIDRGEVY